MKIAYLIGLIVIIGLATLGGPSQEIWRLLTLLAFPVISIGISRWRRWI